MYGLASVTATALVLSGTATSDGRLLPWQKRSSRSCLLHRLS